MKVILVVYWYFYINSVYTSFSNCSEDYLAHTVGEIYSTSFPMVPSASILPILPVLASQTVTEENESGESVESHISVPQSISMAMSDALEYVVRSETT